MNERFLDAALACGAPKADIAGVYQALIGSRPPALHQLELRPFTADEVFHIVTNRIPPKRSKDIYGFSMELLRTVIGNLAHILAHLFNACLSEGAYPNSLKLSKISPIFKGKGKRTDIDGYRPVSIIPTVAKVFENGISSRLVDFLSATDALSPRQYAYRAGRSTTSLAREVVRSVLGAREGNTKLQVAVICCDLSKAFDVADHAVLATKLGHYGIDGAAYGVLTDLMRDRSQVVVGGDEESDPRSSTMGVAQGSSVSNILFSLLLNDLPEAITTAEILMYADDVAAIVTARTHDLLEARLNETAALLAEWFRVNGLGLNLKKTHFMHFCLSGHKTKPIAVRVGGTVINQTDSTTFLGFELDGGLTWESHIDKLCGRLGSACFALRRVARVVPADVARTCYFATVHSVLQYGAELWGRAADWERAFRMQKRAVRALVRIRRDESAKPHFKELRILTLPCIVIMQVAVYVQTNIGNFAKLGETHGYNTRNRHHLAAVPHSLSKSSKLSHVMGPTVYNKLPESVRSASSLTCFKARVKRWLVEQAFYSYQEFISM